MIPEGKEKENVSDGTSSMKTDMSLLYDMAKRPEDYEDKPVIMNSGKKRKENKSTR
jgi:hypothetical protein